METPLTMRERILVGLLIAAAALSGILVYLVVNANASAAARIALLEKNMAESSATYTSEIERLTESLASSTEALEQLSKERDELADDLSREQRRNDDFEDQIRELGSTVGTLDKLAKTDKELLQKYSKVYFLNEHYMPARLSEIESAYLANPSVPKFIHADVERFLNRMMDAARTDGIDLTITSAFRSFDEQEDLKGAYTISYGSGANTFSADQGYSEHQLGTTVDFSTKTLGGALTGFENTPAYEWLTKHAYRFGFVLSYPPNNAYYIFEPWHWRFVGRDLARDLHDDGASFYDLDQRKIDSYLISLFD